MGSALSLPLWMPGIVGPGGEIGSCPSTAEQKSSQILLQIRTHLSLVFAGFMAAPQCGEGLWYRVAYLNMNNPTHECPPNWKQALINASTRVCGRPIGTTNCPGEYFSTRNLQYSKVCGRFIGYQNGSTDGFERHHRRADTIDAPYVDGVSVTHGMPRTHIWTFAAGVSEARVADYTSNCPCANAWAAENAERAPSFVGDNYFCESGNLGSGLDSRGIVFKEDPLWDGEQCEGVCCADGSGSSPPWFSVSLPNPTTDDIEVRICGDEGTHNEDSPIQLLEIYIQ